jgi:hypothetical protein
VSRSSKNARRWRRIGVAAAILLALGAGWEIAGRRGGPTPPSRVVSNLGVVFAGAAASAPIAEPAIVVLPFEDLVAEPGSDSFADGLADEIIRDLARVEGLAVRSRFSSFTSARSRGTCVRSAGDWGPTSPSPVRFCARATGCASTLNWSTSLAIVRCGPNASITSSTPRVTCST